MNDLISRQAAIDLAKDLMIPGTYYLQHNQAIMNYEAEIMQLPSAQPKIVMCKDCKYYVKDHGWNCIEYMVCSISPLHSVLRKPNDFCSRAERRTDG